MVSDLKAMEKYGLPAKLAEYVEVYWALTDEKARIIRDIEFLNADLANVNKSIGRITNTKQVVTDFAECADREYSEDELSGFADSLDYYFGNE